MKMFYVFVKSGPNTWMFEGFEGGTEREAERCAEIMNKGDAAHDYGWKYFAERVND